MRILVRNWEEAFFIKAVENLQERYPQHEFVLQETMIDCHIMVGGRMTKEELELAPSLEEVIVPYTGLNGLPLGLLKEKGVRVHHNHAKAHLVAERALALTLSLMGKVLIYDQGLRAGKWLTRAGWGQEHWTSLYHKEVGILGYGHIGKALQDLLAPFKVRIHVLDRGKDLSGLRKHPSLLDLCEAVEVLYVTLPLTEETRGLLGSQELAALGGYLINVARGPIVKEEDLFQALDKGDLLGAGLDVWYQYPKEKDEVLPSKYDFQNLTNVVMSPHAATHAKEDWHAYYEEALDQLKKILNSFGHF